MKSECDKALADALPALEAAKAAVDCIEKKHIGEMKALGSLQKLSKPLLKLFSFY